MLTFTVLSYLLVGVLLGCFVGILPGLGGATTIALLIPFILPLESQEAIALLIGVAAITATTGDVTSILFGIPGEATSAATVVDGHPMAQRGEAGRAIGAALGSSLVGSIFGGLVLAASIPIAGPLLRSFGSPELFMAAVLGVSFVVPVSGGSRVKGLIVGGLGLSLAMVGLDPGGATPRFTGGTLFLWDGIGLIPTALGLFAIPEIVRMAAPSRSLAQVPTLRNSGSMFSGLASVFSHWPLVLRCSAIGAGVGLLPGMGASVSQWVAYAHAARSSTPTRQFGTGAIEGVLGPASANNATLGGALVPTLALGVPASLSSAMLLSALIIKGLPPGPNMLLPESQGGHLGLVISLVWLMVIGNVIAVGLCLFAARPLLRITRVPGRLLVPFILVLTLLGAFAEKNAVGDLLVTAAMGGLGLTLVRFGWPRIPLMLGVILGPLAESRFFLSMDAYGTAWLLRPGVLVFGIVMLGSFLIPHRRPKHPHEPSPDPSEHEPSSSERAESRRPLLLLLLGVSVTLAAALVQTGQLPARAALFPRLVIATTLLLTLVQLVRSVRAATVAAPSRSTAPPAFSPESRVVMVWVGLFVASIWLLGFVFGAPLAILVYLLTTARQASCHALLLAGGSYLFVEIVMVRTLHIVFPVGSLLEWTGLLHGLSWV